MASVERIMVVDDDSEIRGVTRHALTQAGFEVVECEDGAAALERAPHESIALMILDVDMPRLNGWKTLSQLRARHWNQPVLMVTHVNDVESRVQGLEIGADDYIGKPYNPEELVARVRALLRRVNPPKTRVTHLRFGTLAVDLERKTALQQGTLVRLTRTEYRLMEVLAAHIGTPVSRSDLFGAVWGAKAGVSHTLDTHIWRLRQKIGDVGDDPRWIVNHPGIGFSLAVETAIVPADQKIKIGSGGVSSDRADAR
jgi:DNA-binding response OmpR family regulator